MIRKLFAFGFAVVLALMPVQAFGKTVSITNVSYDPTREMFEQYNKIFEDHWKGKTGEDVEVIQCITVDTITYRKMRLFSSQRAGVICIYSNMRFL